MNFSRYSKILEKQYIGKCDISEFQSKKDPDNKRTIQKEVIVLTGQKCKLSFQNITTAAENDHVGTLKQIVKLFIAPEINIKAGSKITVTQNGITTEYTQSGVPAIYPSHQEIFLELFRGWA